MGVPSGVVVCWISPRYAHVRMVLALMSMPNWPSMAGSSPGLPSSLLASSCWLVARRSMAVVHVLLQCWQRASLASGAAYTGCVQSGLRQLPTWMRVSSMMAMVDRSRLVSLLVSAA